MKQNHKKEKMEEIIRKISAVFIKNEATSNPLISVTKTLVDDKLKKAEIFVSVFPENMEKDALNFLRRKRPLLKKYLEKNIRSRVTPHLDFFIDLGEKNRQRIEELSSEF